MRVSIEKKAAEGNTSSNSLKNISPPEGRVEKAERARISPSNMFPLPKAKAVIKRGKSAKRSEIMTYSPLKNSLLKVTKKREQIIQLGQKRSSMMGLQLDNQCVQE